MEWINKIIIVLIAVVVVAAGAALAILNPQTLSINLWGLLMIEHTIASWSLMVFAVGIVSGVSVASVVIIRLKSQLYVMRRKLLQRQNVLDTQENKK